MPYLFLHTLSFFKGNSSAKHKINNRGFTLIELLIAIAIGGLIMTAMYSVFYSQQKSYAAQNQIAGMQQNLRGAMFFLEKEVRTVGCNPENAANVGIQSPLSSTSIHLTMDLTGSLSGDADGDVDDANEDVTYSLDGTKGALVRNDAASGLGPQVIAENIDWLDFRYLDKNGLETTNIPDIRSVQITIVAKTGKGDQGYKDTNVYVDRNNDVIFDPTPDDNYRRRSLSSEVQCRNLWF